MDITGVTGIRVLTTRELQVDRSQTGKQEGKGSSEKCKWSGLVGAENL